MGNCMSSTKTVKPQSTTQSTKRTQSSISAKPKSKSQIEKPKPKSINAKGHVLGESKPGSTDSKAVKTEKLDPKDAARRAAEERYQATLSKQGTLGQKLQQERGKSTRAHLKDQSEAALKEKIDSELVFD